MMPNGFSPEDLASIRATLPRLREGIDSDQIDELLNRWWQKFGDVWSEKPKRIQAFREKTKQQIGLLAPLVSALRSVEEAVNAALAEPESASLFLDVLECDAAGRRTKPGPPALRTPHPRDGPVGREIKRLLAGLKVLRDAAGQQLE